jgi:SAM-dependent methyltransferase
MTHPVNTDQEDFWTHEAGPKWVAFQQRLDAQLQPILDGVLSRTGLRSGDKVLDVGCGTGTSTLAAADLVGETGHVMGLDISQTMLRIGADVAEGRKNVSFVLADAADHAFEPSSFDHLISRFGVMFFADPVAAFANMVKAMKPGGKVTFAAWGQIPNNPFFKLPAGVARAVLGEMPKPDPDAPGPFAFRDPERVISILNAAGFMQASCEVVDTHLTPSGSLQDFADVALEIGPVESAIRHFEATEAQKKALHAGLMDAIAPFQKEGRILVPAEINYFTATAP